MKLPFQRQATPPIYGLVQALTPQTAFIIRELTVVFVIFSQNKPLTL